MAKRRERGTGSIVQLKDGKFLARVRYDGGQKSARAKTKTEAKQKLKELIAEVEQQDKRTTINYNEVTVKEYFNMFLKYKKEQRGFGEQSYRRLESTIETHIIPRFEYMYMKDLTSDDIQGCIDDAAEKAGLSHSSVKKIFDAFKACYKFSINIKKDIEPYNNPMLAVQMIPEKEFKKSSINIRYLLNEEDNNERKRFITEATRKYKNGKHVYRYGPVLAFIIYTGLRESEMCGLGRDDIFINKKYINVHDTVATIKVDGKWETKVRSDITKYRSERYVPLNKQALEILKQIKEIFPEINETDRLIYTTRKTILPPTELNKTFNRICTAANIDNMDGVGPHCLRHTFAVLLFEKGVNVKTISELLGHSSVKITQDVYISVTKKIKAEAVEMPDLD